MHIYVIIPLVTKVHGAQHVSIPNLAAKLHGFLLRATAELKESHYLENVLGALQPCVRLFLVP